MAVSDMIVPGLPTVQTAALTLGAERALANSNNGYVAPEAKQEKDPWYGITEQERNSMGDAFGAMVAKAFNEDTAFFYFNPQFENEQPSEEERLSGRVPSYKTKAELARLKIENMAKVCRIGNVKYASPTDKDLEQMAGRKVLVKPDGTIVFSDKSADWDISPEETMQEIIAAFFENEEIKKQLVRRVLKDVKPDFDLNELESNEAVKIVNGISKELLNGACKKVPEELVLSFQQDAVYYKENPGDEKDEKKREIIEKYKSAYNKASGAISAAVSENEGKKISSEYNTLKELWESEDVEDIMHFFADGAGKELTQAQIEILSRGSKDEQAAEIIKQISEKSGESEDDYKAIVDSFENIVSGSKDEGFKLHIAAAYLENCRGIEFLEKDLESLGALKVSDTHTRPRPFQRWDVEPFFSAIDEMINLEENFGGRDEDGDVKKSGIPEKNTSFYLLKSVLEAGNIKNNADFQMSALIRMIDLSAHSRNEDIRRAAYNYLKEWQKNNPDGIKKLGNAIKTHNESLVNEELEPDWTPIKDDARRGLNVGDKSWELDIDSPFLSICRSLVKCPPYSAACDIMTAAKKTLAAKDEKKLEKLQAFALAWEVKCTHYKQARPQDLPSLNERYKKWIEHIDEEGTSHSWKKPDEYLKECLNKLQKGIDKSNPLYKNIAEMCDEITSYLDNEKVSSLNRNDMITIMNFQELVEKMESCGLGKIHGPEFEVNKAFFEGEIKSTFKAIVNAHKQGKEHPETDEIGYFDEEVYNGNVLFYDRYVVSEEYGKKFVEHRTKSPKKQYDETINMLLDVKQYVSEYGKDTYLNIPGNPYSYHKMAPITNIEDMGYGRVGCYIGDIEFTTSIKWDTTTLRNPRGNDIPFNACLTYAKIAKEQGINIVNINTRDRENLYKMALALAVNGLDYKCEHVSLTSEQVLELNKIRSYARDRAKNNPNTNQVKKMAVDEFSYVEDKERKFVKAMEVISSVHTDQKTEMDKIRNGFENKMSVVHNSIINADDEKFKGYLREFYLQDKDRFSYLSNDKNWQKVIKDPKTKPAQIFADRFKNKPTDEDLKVISEFIKENPKDALAFIVAQAANDGKLDACLTRWRVDNNKYKQWAETTRELKDRYGDFVSQGEVLAHLLMNKDFSDENIKNDEDIKDVSKALFGDKGDSFAATIDSFAATIIDILAGKEVSDNDMKKFIDSLNPKDLAMLAKECYRLDRKILPKGELSWDNRSMEDAPESKQAEEWADQIYSDWRDGKITDKRRLGKIINSIANKLTAEKMGPDSTYQQAISDSAEKHMGIEASTLVDHKLPILDDEEYKSLDKKLIDKFKGYLFDRAKNAGADKLTAAEKMAVVVLLQKVKDGEIKISENDIDKEFEEKIIKAIPKEQARQTILFSIKNEAKKYTDRPNMSERLVASKENFEKAMLTFWANYLYDKEQVKQDLKENGYANVAKKIDAIDAAVKKVAESGGKVSLEDVAPKFNLLDAYSIATTYSNGEIVPPAEIIKYEQNSLKQGLKDVRNMLEGIQVSNPEIGMYVSVVYASVADKMVSGDKNEVIGDIITGSLLDKINAEAEGKLEGFGILKDGENLKSLESLDESKIDISAVRAKIINADEFVDYKGSGLSDEQKLKEIQKKMNKSKRQLDNVDKTIVQTISQNRAH